MFQRLFNLLEDECHALDLRANTTASLRKSSYEKYMEIKRSLIELEREKDSLDEQNKISQQYLVQLLLTSQDPLNNPTVKTAVQLINNIASRLENIVSRLENIVCSN